MNRILEKRIKSSIRSFDLLSLMRLLVFLGWKWEHFRFSSRDSFASQPALIHDIRFLHEPFPTVRIILNLGLLGPQSTLPDKLFGRINSGELNEEEFKEFIGYFDHLLVVNFLAGLYPEHFSDILGDWESTRHSFLMLQEPASPSTLHWLFTRVFPELEVEVRKAGFSRNVTGPSIILGDTEIGRGAVMGGGKEITDTGLRVFLYTDELLCAGETPWPKTALKRIKETIFPFLSNAAITLEVFLVVTTVGTHAMLWENSYMGYDRIRGGEPSDLRILLFSGEVP